MSKRNVLHYPHSVLRKRCEPITDINEEIIQLAGDMAETMYADKGVGLAAPQIGVSRQLFVGDIGDGLLVLINPEITIAEGSGLMEEGCLCLPGLTVDVKRNAQVQVKGFDLKGKPVTFDADDFLARMFQHEIDHLHGNLIIDRVSKVKRDLVLKKYKKLQQEKD